jgi:hypothetical protein
MEIGGANLGRMFRIASHESRSSEKPYSPTACNICQNHVGLLGRGSRRTYIVNLGVGGNVASLKLPIIEGSMPKQTQTKATE